MESENTWENDSSDTPGDAPKNNKCPKSPKPDDFEPPPMPSKEYYENNIPDEQIALINGIRTKETNSAEEKKNDDIAIADDAYQTAKDAYAKAGRDKDNAIKSLETKSKHKITDLLRMNTEKLIGLLPKGCPVPVKGKETSRLEERVSPDKLAVAVAELNKLLVDEDIDYLKKLKDINLKYADAENVWKKAEITHDSATCEAQLIEEQATKQADVMWRNSLSKLLANLSK